MADKAGGGKDVERKARGRPRDPAVEAAVFLATVEALAADGYGRMSIGDIAGRAGISRPTLYLRWKNLHNLVVEALDWYARKLTAPGSQGDELVDALRSALNMLVPEGRRDLGLGIVGHVIADGRSHPDLLKLVRRKMIEPGRKLLIAVLNRYRDEGVITGKVDPGILADLMMGFFVAEFMNTGDLKSDAPERVANAVWPLVSGKKRPGLRAGHAALKKP